MFSTLGEAVDASSPTLSAIASSQLPILGAPVDDDCSKTSEDALSLSQPASLTESEDPLAFAATFERDADAQSSTASNCTDDIIDSLYLTKLSLPSSIDTSQEGGIHGASADGAPDKGSGRVGLATAAASEPIIAGASSEFPPPLSSTRAGQQDEGQRSERAERASTVPTPTLNAVSLQPQRSFCPSPVAQRRLFLDKGMASVLNLSPTPLLVTEMETNLVVWFNLKASELLGFKTDQQVQLERVLPGVSDGDVGKAIGALTAKEVGKTVILEGCMETTFAGFIGKCYSFTEASQSTAEASRSAVDESDVGMSLAASGASSASQSTTRTRRASRNHHSLAAPASTPSIGSPRNTGDDVFTPLVEFYNAELHAVQSSLPPGVLGLGLDDSVGQRCMLNRIFKQCGVSPENTETFGSTDENVDDFAGAVMERMKNRPQSEMLLIVDESLGWNCRTGSEIAQELLTSMTNVERSRLTLFMRSANDDSASVTRFLAFADGFLSKSTGLDMSTKAVLKTRRELTGLGNSSGMYRKRASSTNQWSAAMVVELRECCNRLEALGPNGAWNSTKACVHKIKGTLMLCGQKELLTEATFLSIRNQPPVGWADGGFEEFLGMIQRFVKEFGF